MASIDLLRHGATTAPGSYCGSTDVALSAAGLQQMRDATQGRHWDRILSSPLQRCAVFAAALAAERGIPCGFDPRLRELHFGDWEGLTAAELQQRNPEALGRFWQDPERYPPPGAETLAALRERVLDCCGELLRHRAADERILIVSHGGPIRILLAARDGLPLRRALEIEVPHAGLFSLGAR